MTWGSGQSVEVSGGGDPVHVGHPDVHQHDVGLQRGAAVKLSSVGGLADDVDGGVGGQDHPQSGAHEGVVVDESTRTGPGWAFIETT